MAELEAAMSVLESMAARFAEQARSTTMTSTLPFGSVGMAWGMRRPQVQWLWPRLPRKSKRKGPQEASSTAPRRALAASAVRGHGAGARRAPKAGAKGGHGVEAKTVNKYNLDDDEAVSIGARVPAPPQALAERARDASIGARIPAPPQALAALVLRGRGTGTMAAEIAKANAEWAQNVSVSARILAPPQASAA
jgi:hypothetical protein